MAFLTPLSFLLLLLIPLVIMMYLLKLRRTEQQVSSVYLWQRMVRDLEANAPWQRLRRNLLLLLQVLFLAFIILALARPFTRAEGSGSQSTIIIIDTSASMAAKDAAPDRLEAAKDQAQRVVDELPDDARVTVIGAGQSAQILVASSQDRRQAYLAIDKLKAQPGDSRMTDALELASAIAARQPETEIVVLTDGNVNLPDRLALQGQVRYLPVGTEADNQAINLLTLERTADGSGLTGFAQVSSYADPETEPVQRRLGFYADDQLVQAFDLTIEPGTVQAVIAPDLPPDADVITARLNGDDLLKIDDQAWVVNRPILPVQVELVSQGNRFLETGLNLMPGVEMTTILPEDWDIANREETATDLPQLTIFDGYVPESRQLPDNNLLFLGPISSNELFTVTGSLDSPSLRAGEADEPLLVDLVDLEMISVLDASRIPLPQWARAAMISDTPEGQFPMLFRGEVNNRRIAVLSFDLRRSDLPLQIAFPILLSNLMNWLVPAQVDIPGQVQPGESISFNLPVESAQASLIYPDGSQITMEKQQGRFITPELDQLGVYELQWGAGEKAFFAVNLFSPQESKIEPAGMLPLFGDSQAGNSSGQQMGKREWWRPLVWLALALLVAEWLVYQRANLRRIWDGIQNRVGLSRDPEQNPPKNITGR